MKSDDIYKILFKRYKGTEHAYMEEVSDAAGFGRSRSADAVVMNLWPSRGLHLTGFEVKASRTDWLKELKNPAKAENIIKYCDYWWLLAGDDSVVLQPGIEIPTTWGYMVIRKNRLVVVKEAPKLEPAVLSRSFLAAMLKRVTGGMVPRSSIQNEIDNAIELGCQNKRRQHDYEVERLTKKVSELQKIITDFETASELSLSKSEWSSENKNLGKLVNIIRKSNPEEMRKELERISGVAKKINETIQQQLILLNDSSIGKVVDNAGYLPDMQGTNTVSDTS